MRGLGPPLTPPPVCGSPGSSPPDWPEPQAQLRWSQRPEEPAPTCPLGFSRHQESSDRGPGPGWTRPCSWHPVTWEERSQGLSDALAVAINSCLHPRGMKGCLPYKIQTWPDALHCFLQCHQEGGQGTSCFLCLGTGPGRGPHAHPERQALSASRVVPEAAPAVKRSVTYHYGETAASVSCRCHRDAEMGVGALSLRIDEGWDCPHWAGERTEAPGVSEVESQQEVQGWDPLPGLCGAESRAFCCWTRVPERSRLPEFPSFKLM